MFQIWGKIALICCKKGAKHRGNCSKIGASGEYLALKRGQMMNVWLQKGGKRPLIIALYKCYFISESVFLFISATSSVLLLSVLLYISVTLYQHHSLSTLLYISIVSVEESSESGYSHQHILKYQPAEQCTGDAEQHIGNIVMA